MIIIDVFCAEVNHNYDFQVDETIRTEQVISEIITLIIQKEHLSLERKRGNFILCDKIRGVILANERTLAENHVQYGDTLLLI